MTIMGVRFVIHGHRWFLFTGAALLHAVFHGLFGLSYLVSGVLAVVLAAIGVTVSVFKSGVTRVNPEGSP